MDRRPEDCAVGVHTEFANRVDFMLALASYLRKVNTVRRLSWTSYKLPSPAEVMEGACCRS